MVVHAFNPILLEIKASFVSLRPANSRSVKVTHRETCLKKRKRKRKGRQNYCFSYLYDLEFSPQEIINLLIRYLSRDHINIGSISQTTKLKDQLGIGMNA